MAMSAARARGLLTVRYRSAARTASLCPKASACSEGNNASWVASSPGVRGPLHHSNKTRLGIRIRWPLLSVIRNSGNACREPVSALINTEVSRTIIRTSLDECHCVGPRGFPPVPAVHRRLTGSRVSPQIHPKLPTCGRARRNSTGQCPHETLESHHARPDSSVLPGGSRRHSAVPLFQERARA